MLSRFTLHFAGLLFFAGAMFAQPRVTQVVNGASYTPNGLPGSAIAKGSIFVIKGTGLGPATLVQSGAPRPTDLSGTSIRISGGGQNVSAFMIYASATQLAAILPSSTPTGNATLTVTYNGQTSDPAAFNVVQNGPGLFTLNQGGSGPAVLTDPNFNVLTYTNATHEGDVIIAWATGITPITSPDNEGAPVFDPPLTVEVFVGNKLANVRFRGRAPGFTGLDQIVFDVPQGVRGCNVSLAMRVGGNISNFTSLPVAAAGQRVCSDPNGFTQNDLSGNVLANGLRLGVLSLSRTTSKITVPGFGSIDSKSDSADGSFSQYTGAQFIGSRAIGGGSYGSCTVYTFSGNLTTADPVAPKALDAGASLSLQGPGGTKTLTKQATGAYHADLGTSTSIPIPGAPGQTAYLDPGTYTVTGPGGADVGAFTARITLPQPFNWTNMDSVGPVQRSSDLSITWSGGNPSAEFVTVAGTSSRSNPNAGAYFVCVAPSSAGQLTVPSIVLSSLPPSQDIQGAPTGAIIVSSSPTSDAGRFTASGLDGGVLSYSTSLLKTLSFQ